MKRQAIVFALGLLTAAAVGAQPYEFDQNQPDPTEVRLVDDPENAGVKLGSISAALGESAARLYLKGLIEYQPVDIFVKPVDTDEPITVELVKATWEDVVGSCNATAKSVCQFSVRTLGDVGVKLSGKSGTEYVLLTVVGEEIRPPLETPFYKIEKQDLNALETPSTAEPEVLQENGGSNIMTYVLVALVIALVLAVVFLLGKRSRPGSDAATVLALIASFVLLDASLAQSPEPESGTDGRSSSREEWRSVEEAKKKLDVLPDTAKKIDELRKIKKSFETFWSSYTGLGDCISAGDGFSRSARIPSFCENQAGCDACFLAAREQFNQVRYYLGRLKTIHSCTIKMTDGAKAFGDSFSTATQSGIGWTVARQQIEKSVTDLNKAYDAKYADLMGDLGKSMVEMAICEAQYGLEDWYDRFGFVYYEFMQDKYKRN